MGIFFTLNVIILLLAMAVNLGLGIYVYYKDRTSPINRTFGTILFWIAFWVASFLFFFTLKAPEWVLFVRRINPVGSAIVAGYFLYFSNIFPKKGGLLSKIPNWLFIVPGYLFGFLSIFTPLIIESITLSGTQALYLSKPIYGPLYSLYALYLMVFFSLSIINLISKYFPSSGMEKLQLFYVIFGMGISLVCGIFFSLILPLMGNLQLYTIGPPFSLILVFFISYTIIKHNLMNIGDFLSRGLFYLGISTAIIATVACFLTREFSFILPIYVILGNLILGLLVLLNNSKSKINISFAIFSALIALWSGTILIFGEIIYIDSALFWFRVSMVASSFIPAILFYFSSVFPREQSSKKDPYLYICFSFAALFAILSFTGYIIQDININHSILTGALFPVFVAYYILFMVLAFWRLYEKYLGSSGFSKLQIKYVFLGFFLGNIFPIITNYLLPIMGEVRYISFGPIFSMLTVSFVSYAIFRHRLMSFELVLRRSAVYMFATILIMALYALAVAISETFFKNILGYSSFFITAGATLLIAIIYQPIVRLFQNLTDRFFFKGRYDYQASLRKISQEIASVIKLEELTRILSNFFIETMRISELSFLILEKSKEHFISVPISAPRYNKIEIDIESPIVSWLSSYKDVLIGEEIEEEIMRSHEPRILIKSVRDEMERLGISVWVPIISKDELVGIIALGNKLSGDFYTAEDLFLLTTLASQTAVALDNARLYSEVLSMKNYNDDILQSMTNGVLTTDINGKIITFNHAAELVTGKKILEVLGKTCEEVWGKRGAIGLAIDNTLRDHPAINFETGIAGISRGLVPVSLYSTLLRDTGKRKIGALLSIHDLSDIKELESKVRRADKLAALATLAAGMAHEIKNPLSSMKVLAQLLPIKFQDPEFRKKMEEILPREIDRIDRIVESLLGFARATSPKFEKIKIETIIDTTLTYFYDQAENAGVKIEKSYAELPEIEVDKDQISQVFSNLILNAIQAMTEGGTVKISTHIGKKTDNIIQTIIIQVTDTGPGISEENKKRLFDPFFTTKYGGTGLGLAISHSIVDSHKGYIDIESTLGKGTTFTVTLPVSQRLL
ncbi:MAG: ATP-binding protein [Candidatus Margulisiibacteriota bacterium]